MKDERYFLSLIKWTCIGLLIRVLIMPFTLDIDMFWINYIPSQFVNHGIWDVYSFARDNFWGRIGATNNPYYPPLTVVIVAFFQFLLKPLMPTLNAWLGSYDTFIRAGGGMFMQHVALPHSEQIFRNLFLLKVPILAFDLGIGALLLKLARRRLKDPLPVYILWMLNPVTLYAAFGYGQIDIYPTFFVVLSIYFADCKRPYLSMISLGLGALTKSYPLILMPIAAVFLGRRLSEQFKLMASGVCTIAAFYLPFILSSGTYSVISIMPGGTIGTGFGWDIKHMIMRGMFMLSYAAILFGAMFMRQKDGRPRMGLETYFLVALLTLFAFQPVAERFYVWITPFLVFCLLKDRGVSVLIFLQLASLLLLRLQSSEQWAGIFSPLNPEYFMSRPFIYNLVSPFLSIISLQQLAYRSFVIVTLVMIFLIIRNDLNAKDRACS
jgi:hypothetical protein